MRVGILNHGATDFCKHAGISIAYTSFHEVEVELAKRLEDTFADELRVNDDTVAGSADFVEHFVEEYIESSEVCHNLLEYEKYLPCSLF